MSRNPIDKTSVYVAAGLISGCGALMFNVMPVFVSAMAMTLNFGERQLGDIIALFNIGFTLAALSAFFWVNRLDWRLGSGLGIMGAAATLIALAAAPDFMSVAILTTGVGIAMGMLYAIVLAILGGSDEPDRAFGLKLGLETLPGAALLFLMPVFVMPQFGFSGVTSTMAAVLLALGLAVFYLPRHGARRETASLVQSLDQGQRPPLLLPLLALLSSLVFFVGISAAWAFLELLAADKNLPRAAVASVLAIAFIICGLGGFAAAAIGSRFGRIPPLAAIIALNLAGLWLLGSFTSLSGYALGSILFLFSVNFTLAYTFGLTAEVDHKGRLVVLSAASLSLGAIIGPATAGRLIESAGYGMALGFSAACSLTALVIYLAVVRLMQKRC